MGFNQLAHRVLTRAGAEGLVLILRREVSGDAHFALTKGDIRQVPLVGCPAVDPVVKGPLGEDGRASAGAPSAASVCL